MLFHFQHPRPLLCCRWSGLVVHFDQASVDCYYRSLIQGRKPVHHQRDTSFAAILPPRELRLVLESCLHGEGQTETGAPAVRPASRPMLENLISTRAMIATVL